MKVSIRDRLEAVGAPAWDGLVAASRLRSPFLSWTWQCEWSRTFADGQLSDVKDDTKRQLIQRAARYLAVYLAQQPDRESCLRLLKCAQQAQLSPDFQLELAYTFASLMESSGTWTAWASYL